MTCPYLLKVQACPPPDHTPALQSNVCVGEWGETIDMPVSLKLQARPPQDHRPALQSNVCVCVWGGGGGWRTIDMPIFSEGSDMPTDDPSHALTMGLHLAPFRGNGVQGVPLQCTIVYLYTQFI